MPGITAILHTHNDALRIARAVESLRCCDEVLVVDHGSDDETPAIARRFGARVIERPGEPFDTESHLLSARHDWIFCLLPSESISEGLEASLLEWKLLAHSVHLVFGVSIREEADGTWVTGPGEARLVHRANAKWNGWRPLVQTEFTVLDGDLFRLDIP